MNISDAPYNAPLRYHMSAALELAWEAVCWEVSGLLPVDRESMERNVLSAVAMGERDFILLQRRAIAASRATTAMPIERRRNARLTAFDGDRRQR